MTGFEARDYEGSKTKANKHGGEVAVEGDTFKMKVKGKAVVSFASSAEVNAFWLGYEAGFNAK